MIDDNILWILCVVIGISAWFITVRLFLNNDDLEDRPTKVSITYCKDCGKIIKVKIVDNIPTSSYQEIKEFYEVTKYNLRQNSPIEDFLCK